MNALISSRTAHDRKPVSFSSSDSSQSFFTPTIQAKLRVNAPDDSYETEADVVADQVMRMPDPEHLQTKNAPIAIQTKCAKCEKDEKLRRKEKGQDKETLSTDNTIPDSVYRTIKMPGQPMDDNTRSFMETRFGHGFDNVRIHTGTIAAQSAQAINANAYTNGNNIVFDHGQYAPHTDKGKMLLAHELTHVIQQTPASSTIQRTVHGSNTPRTPTNCHNWKIPLPPWIAGTLAHSQIADFMAGSGVAPHLIPRATKLFSALPNPPLGIPPGFADLYFNTGSQVKVAEIKSTAAGDAAAHPQARHYRNRHNQWLARLAVPPLAVDDARYLSSVGGPLPGGLLDLSSFTGTGISIGPFSGDPLKQLHIEADSRGGMVYWCTGIGTVNPLWLKVLQDLYDDLKDLLNDMKRVMQEIMEGIGQVLDWIGDNAPVIAFVLLVIALLALIALIIVCAIAAPETGGLTLACSYLGLLGAVEAVAAILIILGFSSAADDVREAGEELAMTAMTENESEERVNGESYEAIADISPITTGGSPSSGGSGQTDESPAQRFAKALSPIMTFDGLTTLVHGATSVPDNAQEKLAEAAGILEGLGDTSTASMIRSGMGRLS